MGCKSRGIELMMKMKKLLKFINSKIDSQGEIKNFIKL